MSVAISGQECGVERAMSGRALGPSGILAVLFSLA